MSTERTFAIIKPDAVERQLAGKILARIYEAGFTVRAMRLQHLIHSLSAPKQKNFLPTAARPEHCRRRNSDRA